MVALLHQEKLTFTTAGFPFPPGLKTMKYLITIVGPTAIGKTSLSIALAQHFHCDIISCDSRQFFEEMRIGTAVPTTEELAGAPHHFIQNKSIFENYTVGDFEKEAIAKLDELFLTNDYVVLVGGSGLYVDAVLKGFDEFPEIDYLVREEIQSKYDNLGIAYLQQQLEVLDNDYFKELQTSNPQTLQNPQRMMRFCGSLYRNRKTVFFLFKPEEKHSKLHSHPHWFGSRKKRDLQQNQPARGYYD